MLAIEPNSTSDFRAKLIDSGLLFPTGIDGLWGRGAVYELIHDGLDRFVSQASMGNGAEVMRFPPAMPQTTFERSGYMKNFPQLAGTVHCFCGDDRAHHKLLAQIANGQNWLADQVPADLVLTPASCYPVYPIVAQRGPLDENGHLVDVASYCFRHEPSLEPTRFQVFRMREYVKIGTADQVVAFREMWIEHAKAMVQALSLPFKLMVANDAFFGRAGQLMADNQRTQELKFELLIPINDGMERAACISFNYHMTYFGDTWGIRLSNGEAAHTACVAFGMERIVLALLRHHGLDLASWPTSVLTTLGLN